MPEALQAYLDGNGDLGTVRILQTDLVDLFKEDIAKHAGGRVLQVKAIYDAIRGTRGGDKLSSGGQARACRVVSWAQAAASSCGHVLYALSEMPQGHI